MNWKGVDLCCPRCSADLVLAERAETPQAEAELLCAACNCRYPILAGIPDLRIFADPYIGIEADRKKGLEVAARLGDLPFPDLIDFYYRITDVVPAHHARQYKRGLLAGVARAQASLAAWEAAAGDSAADLLEIGCGTAPLLVAAAGRFGRLAGVDIAFRWLVVARKRLIEAGLDLPLICACAEALPFRAGQFDRVALDSAIEVVDDQKKALEECYRVLRPSGYIFLATPNRYSPGPDPHMGVWTGSLWPKRLLEAYARRHGAVTPKRNLLDIHSLGRLARQAGFARPRIVLARIPEAQRRQFSKGMQWLIGLYQLAQRLPLSRQLLYWIGPLLQAVARKPAAPGALP